ncbi:hypothetical protein PR048_032195 [Dryococelus australis]|uniref:Uncharacterized protein n=1 Tax=Dryococelus australis TaxID=614101 RepID=A0ABQ9G4J0_9NEOP|nr:hypothetical protein PR048_032195 [Dryococelus australis]
MSGCRGWGNPPRANWPTSAAGPARASLPPPPGQSYPRGISPTLQDPPSTPNSPHLEDHEPPILLLKKECGSGKAAIQRVTSKLFHMRGPISGIQDRAMHRKALRRSPRKPAAWYDSHLRKSGVNRPGIERGSPWWEEATFMSKVSEEIRAALNSGVLRADEVWSGAGMNGRRKREIPEKTHQPTASSSTIPTCESPVTRPGIDPGSPWWEASVLIAQPPWSLHA